MPRKPYLFIEKPDTTARIDFAGLCTVELSIEGDPPALWIRAKGCDDRASIMIDEVLMIPEPDTDE